MGDGRQPKLFARIEPELHAEVKAEADRLFDGNESMLVRRAVRLFIDRVKDERRRAEQSAMTTLVGTDQEASAA